MARTDLGKWMLTNGGEYNPETTYEHLTIVKHDNGTYITLKTVTGVTPSDDKVNYILMAQGLSSGGEYDPNTVYKSFTMITYDNSTYMTLKPVSGVTPSDDKVNYTLIAQGYSANDLSDIIAEDAYGVLGTAGATVSAQSLVDWIADQAMNKLIKKAAMSNQQVNDVNKVPTSALAYSMQQAITKLNGDLDEVAFYRGTKYLQADFKLGEQGYKLQIFSDGTGIKLFDSSWAPIWQAALKSDLSNTLKTSGTSNSQMTTSETYASMSDHTMKFFACNGDSVPGSEFGYSQAYEGLGFLLIKHSEWRGFGLAGSLYDDLFFGRLSSANTLSWHRVVLQSDFDAIYTQDDNIDIAGAWRLIKSGEKRKFSILNIYGGAKIFGQQGNYLGEIFINKGCITGIMVDHWTGNLYTVKGATFEENNLEFIKYSRV